MRIAAFAGGVPPAGGLLHRAGRRWGAIRYSGVLRWLPAAVLFPRASLDAGCGHSSSEIRACPRQDTFGSPSSLRAPGALG